ncbi:MAG: sulfotransferase [Bacteroidales bacterium]
MGLYGQRLNNHYFCSIMLTPVKKIFIPLLNLIGKQIEQKHFPKPPVLIGGCGRSGTTLLLSILSAHPSVFAFPDELSIYNHWKTNKKGEKVPLRKDRKYRYLLTHRIPGQAVRWCEKTPYNVRYIEDILAHFKGNVRFIHIIRDGRDVCLSKHPDKPGTYWVEPERWINDVKQGLRFYDHPKVFTIYYEHLVFHYKKYIKELLNFLEEPYTSQINEWISNTDVKTNKAWYGSVKNLHSQSVGKWKKAENRERVEQLMAIPEFRSLLQTLNYV